MCKSLVVIALSLAVTFPVLARADELNVTESGASDAPISLNLPGKGQTAATVLKTYGPPEKKHPPAGGDTPKHPPITRWDYPDFSVFFERNHVVDAVVPGHPAQIYHVDTLRPATASD